jgi:hypothetical protein
MVTINTTLSDTAYLYIFLLCWPFCSDVRQEVYSNLHFISARNAYTNISNTQIATVQLITLNHIPYLCLVFNIYTACQNGTNSYYEHTVCLCFADSLEPLQTVCTHNITYFIFVQRSRWESNWMFNIVSCWINFTSISEIPTVIPCYQVHLMHRSLYPSSVGRYVFGWLWIYSV